MTLEIKFNPNRAVVTFADGRTEEFATRSDAYTKYPQLAVTVVLSRREERRVERAQARGRNNGYGYSRSSRS